MKKEFVLLLTLLSLLLLSACSAAAKDQPAAEVMDPMVEEGRASLDMAAGSDTVSEGSEPGQVHNADSAMRPAWQELSLTDARSGETFRLADFAGQTVFVEPMATWCSNCRRQLGQVQAAQQQLAGEEVVFVALSVETNLEDAALASYADGAGFNWLFAVATPELLGQLSDAFGRAITNPPATPHFIIRPDGTTTDLITGIEPVEQIITQIAAAQG